MLTDLLLALEGVLSPLHQLIYCICLVLLVLLQLFACLLLIKCVELYLTLVFYAFFPQLSDILLQLFLDSLHLLALLSFSPLMMTYFLDFVLQVISYPSIMIFHLLPLCLEPLDFLFKSYLPQLHLISGKSGGSQLCFNLFYHIFLLLQLLLQLLQFFIEETLFS